MKNKLKIKINNKKGFTLLELIVSVAIIGIVSSISIANYKSVNIQNRLVTSTHNLVNNLRLSQTYSLGSKEFGGNISSGGWGVYFNIANPDYYIIFADTNGDKDYTSSAEKHQQVELSKNVSINKISDIFHASLSELAITFVPPDPTIYINSSTINTASIILNEDINNSTSTISINFFGLVDYE